MIQSIVIIGTGNLAQQWCSFLSSKKFNILQIAGRNQERLEKISTDYKLNSCNDLSQINKSADAYFLCINDDAISEVSEFLTTHLLNSKFLVHFSGAQSYEIIDPYFDHRAVLWPLQSFNQQSKIEWEEIPFFFEGSASSLEVWSDFAKRFHLKFFQVDPQKKKNIHLAAVFANNFSNFNLVIAAEILKRVDIPFDVLKAIMKSSLSKAFETSPELSQTGPAIRQDHKVIHAQLELLTEFEPSYKDLYEKMSELIDQHFNKKINQ